MLDLSILYIFIGGKVNHTGSKNSYKVGKLSLVRANNLHKLHCPLFCQATSLKSPNCPSPIF